MSSDTDNLYTVANVENFFWQNPTRDEDFFNESPHNRVSVTARNSSSIDTSAIDGYRQGVEIRSIKHFDAGTIKIHAGEPGHIVKPTTYGLNGKYYENGPFQDSGGVDPVQFLNATSSVSRYVMAQPFICVTSRELDSRAFDRYLYDGVIDSLGVRRRAMMLYTNTPIDARGVRGEMQDGNIDEFGGTNSVVSIYNWNVVQSRERPYFDDPQLMDDRWASNIQVTVALTGSRVTAFDDARLLRNAQTASHSYHSTMADALSLMTGSTNNFISVKQRSATSGWDYDNNGTVGTDSIAFGGMTY